MMNGIDIASYQTGINLGVVPCDFVIVKATEGTGYVNPDFDRAYDQAIANGKLVGIYHYANGRSSGAAEADYFLYWVGSRVGTAILVLDWEQGGNYAWGNTAYAKAFLDRVYEKTGVRPLIYMSKSVCYGYNWSSVAPDYGLWVAQYANYQPTGYQSDPWTDNNGYGAWTNGPVIFQYTSSGHLAGWSGNLDLNVAYMDAVAWTKYAQGDNYKGESEDNEEMGLTAEEITWVKQMYANSKATEPDSWFTEAMASAVAKGITDGERPKDAAKREEVAVMIDRALGKIENK